MIIFPEDSFAVTTTSEKMAPLNDNLNIDCDDKFFMGATNVRTHYNNFKGDVIFTFYNENDAYSLCYNERMDGKADYRGLWKLLIDKNIKNKTDLIGLAGISTNVLAKLNRGDFISMDSLQKICKALHCDVGDICVMNESIGEE